MTKLLIAIILTVIASPVFAQGNGAPNIVSGYSRPAYVPGEILVKYQPYVNAKTIDEHYQIHYNVTTLYTHQTSRIRHLRLPAHMTVEQALEVYGRDPGVAYVEPNYYLYASATPDDIFFNQLWGLHNSGQIVNATSGTVDADIDAVEAWDITTGSSDVVVAVVDSGVDYNHVDLDANIWTNADEIAGNGIDDDGNGYVDDIRGWDFVDNDNVPLDSEGHGTHVAGIIAALGNNAAGIAGVVWSAKIMILRFLDANGSGTTADAVRAIEYADAKGASVINCSWGGAGLSASLQDAIEASSAVVICAAGSAGTDNDAAPEYPASFSSANIVSVAATDQDDNLASFSNFGTTSVDVAAPGTNVYSSKPDRQTLWSDNFNDNDISDWTFTGTNNTWGTTNAFASSRPYSLTDSPAGDYVDNTDSRARAPVLNLTSRKATRLDFKLQGKSESNADFLYVQASIDLTTWTDKNIGIQNSIYARISGSATDWVSATVDLGAYDGQGTVYVRFRFTTDASTAFDGWYIDDVTVTAADNTYSGAEYQFLQGTSMAAAHVSGLAALVKAQNSALTHTQIKAAIENSVDAKIALSGKIATNGRVNAAGALTPPAPSGLSATAVSYAQINLSWTDNSPNESGFKIERKSGSDGTYEQIAIAAAGVTAYSDTGLSDSTTYYYRLRAYNNAGNSGYTNEAEATTPVKPPRNSGGGGGCFITAGITEKWNLGFWFFPLRFLTSNRYWLTRSAFLKSTCTVYKP